MMTIPAEPGSLLLLKRSNVDSLQVKDGEELLLDQHSRVIYLRFGAEESFDQEGEHRHGSRLQTHPDGRERRARFA